MSSDFSMANTCVFWDVEDCPIPDGHDPGSVYQNIKSALADKGYRGNVDIWAYGEKNKIRDEFLLTGIIFVPEGDKCARANRMMSDVLFWALDNPSDEPVLVPNVMVISKNISQDTEFLWVLQVLQWRCYNILLADSDNVPSVKQHDLHELHMFVSSIWLWTSLLDGGNPIDLSQSSQSVDNKLKCKERSIATCSGSSEGVASKRWPKKMKSQKPPKAKSGAYTDSEDMKSKSPKAESTA